MQYVERDSTDWPKGMTDEEKLDLCEKVREVLNRNPSGLPLWLVYECVRDKHPLAFKNAVVLDWLYAATERALRAIDAENVWQIRNWKGRIVSP